MDERRSCACRHPRPTPCTRCGNSSPTGSGQRIPRPGRHRPHPGRAAPLPLPGHGGGPRPRRGRAAAAGDRAGHPAGRDPDTAFLFPGQGALRAGYGQGAHTLLPVFRDVFEDCREQVRRRFGVELAPVLDPATPAPWFADTRHQQLGLFVLGYGLARQLESWDVRPAALFGHSIGEYTAAAVAGVWSLPDALGLVRERAEAMHGAAPGRMLALRIGAEQAATLLDDDVTLAVAGGDHVVLSGPERRITALAAAQRELGVHGRLLETGHAFHSPLMASSAEALREAVAATPHQAPASRSSRTSRATGPTRPAWATPTTGLGQLLGTVRLEQGLDTLAGGGAEVLIELGPGDGLSRQATGGAPGTRTEAVPLLGRDPAQEATAVLRALGRLWERGVEVPWEELRPRTRGRLVSLPPCPMAPTPCRAAPGPDRPGPTGQNPAGGPPVPAAHVTDRERPAHSATPARAVATRTARAMRSGTGWRRCGARRWASAPPSPGTTTTSSAAPH
ncbi:acyltransferase domain-containing protein [Streptomyces stramineus]